MPALLSLFCVRTAAGASFSSLRQAVSPSLAVEMAALQPIAGEGNPSTDFVRVKRKKTTIFLYVDLTGDTVHDLRAKVNHITKVPTTDIKFFIDQLGEMALDENKTLTDQKASRTPPPPIFFTRATL